VGSASSFINKIILVLQGMVFTASIIKRADGAHLAELRSVIKTSTDKKFRTFFATKLLEA
jgi:hypothetical protein